MYKITYEDLLDIEKIESVYGTIRRNTKHKAKILKFELFYMSNITHVYDILKSNNYIHEKYNIFLISEPKHRLIMSEGITDKIVNHLISEYVLKPLIYPTLIDANVATRRNLGTKAGIYYFKKYINNMKEKYDKIYILKCDISKYFYSIDHNILISELSKLIDDEDILNIIKNIINSTDNDVNDTIKRLKDKRIEEIKYLNISDFNKEKMIREVESIPYYELGRGLPIGNMSSQILAIFYLNTLDHYIKEVLGIKCYIRYMDDFLLIHQDKEYLQVCLRKIDVKVRELNLKLNAKTQIYEIHNGINFLGYRFLLSDKRLHVLMSSKVRKRINKKIKYLEKKDIGNYLYYHYNGYLHIADTKGFIYKRGFIRNDINLECLEVYLNMLLKVLPRTHSYEMLYYEAIIKLLGVSLSDDYIIKSNVDAVKNLCDILLKCIDKALGYVLEFKIASDDEDMESLAKTALEQIKDKEYYQELILDKVKDIRCVSIVFKDKSCIVRY